MPKKTPKRTPKRTPKNTIKDYEEFMPTSNKITSRLIAPSEKGPSGNVKSRLNSRLKLRNTESNSERESRLKVAVEEIKEKDCYDYIVVNNEKKVAASEILSIINGFE